MNLYEKLKPFIPEVSTGYSDHELLALNRRPYLISQISGAQGFLTELGLKTKLTLSERQLLHWIEFVARTTRNESELSLHITYETVFLHAFYFYFLIDNRRIHISSSVKLKPMSTRNILINEVLDSFFSKIVHGMNEESRAEDSTVFSLTICDASNTSSVMSAARNYHLFKRAQLIVKNYSLIKNPEHREYFDRILMFPYISFEGHAFFSK